MKKTIQLIGAIFLLLFIGGAGGCPPIKHTPRSTPPLFYQHLSKGESAESKKDLAKALDYYNQALIAAPRKSDDQVKAHQMVLRVERKMNKAKKYCELYKTLIKAGKQSEAKKALKQVHRIWPFYSECNLRSPPDLRLPTIPDVGSYRILDEKPVIHKIKSGNIISKLCQRYYGQTGNYKLVRIITHYNKIDSKSLPTGQKIKFPSIQLNGNIYRPKKSAMHSKPKPTPTLAPVLTPTPTSTPAPQPSVTPTPTLVPVNNFNKAVELFRKGQYADAVATLNNVADTSPEKEDSLRLLCQCHFRLAQIAIEKAHYRAARDTLHKALEICQRLQESDLPSECEQIENLFIKCDAQIKTKAIKEHLDKGKQLLNASRIDLAIAEFEKVLASEPNHDEALEYIYLAHFKKAHRLWENKDYRKALEEFVIAWEYNKNCEECKVGINKIKGVLYTKAKALEKKLVEPDAPIINILQEQIEYYTIIIQLDPRYEDVAELLEKARKRKKYLKGKNSQ